MLIAKLKPDAYERAQELASAEVSTEVDGAPGLRRFIFLSPAEVVFLVEGDDVELRTREWFDDPVRSERSATGCPSSTAPCTRHARFR